VAGELRPSAGRVTLSGVDITGLPPYRIFRHGLVRTFQLTRPFAELSVLDNLLVAPGGQLGERFWNNWWRRGCVARQEQELRERARAVLELLDLAKVAAQPAKNLSGGQRKLLEIGRALMAEPKLILLDEPGAGVNRALLDVIIERLRELNRRGISLFIIEHNMDLVGALCDPVLVMADGKLLVEGSAREVQQNPRVIDAYLGGAA
jgi:branched-chain amino acid transport system ATP-binding protein